MLPGPFEHWLPMTERIAVSMSRRYHAPRDDVYDHAVMGLVEAWAAEKEFSSPSTHIRNHVLKGMRDHKRRRGPITVDIDEIFDVEDVNPGMSELAFHRELWDHVGRLPRDEAKAIQLVYKWGFSQAEAGGMLGVDQQTVSRRIASGVARLRARFEGEPEPEPEERLVDRASEVKCLVERGLTTAQIAERLEMHPMSVARLRRKAGCSIGRGRPRKAA